MPAKDFGDVVALLMTSPIHRAWTVADLERLIRPPLRLDQCVLIRDGSTLTGYGSYAFLTEEAEAGFISGDRKIGDTDWRGGDRIWFMDAIASNGDAKKVTAAMRKDLRDLGFAGRMIRFRRNKGGHRRYSKVII